MWCYCGNYGGEVMNEKLIDETLSKILHVFPTWKKMMHSLKRSPSKLKMMQVMVLHTITEFGCCNMSMLSNQEEISAQQLTRVIDELVQKKYVERWLNPDNRREVLVQLTPLGKEALEEAQQLVTASFRETLLDFTEDELLRLQEGFTIIEDVIENRKKG